jgi:hypothetical protein
MNTKLSLPPCGKNTDWSGKRGPRRVFGHKTQEVTEGERKLHNNDFFMVKGPAAEATNAPQP